MKRIELIVLVDVRDEDALDDFINRISEEASEPSTVFSVTIVRPEGST